MSIKSAAEAINLVGKRVIPVDGSERHAKAHGRPQAGIVIDIYMPDINHPYVVVQFTNTIDHMYPFELEVLGSAAA